ncbi:hypothetical protein A2W54_04270 [Candidatus Giovannonibacteria bacterium RIFCSPHIGHO2_02_43_13]|uniref:Recombination protein RecR n=1 Tax=Candidatus Giovannonibacteria bacterium RIFCSPHIGHO2_02_43_13 TaxID=1798330 RepID=A0A1F5WT85_9BACT|nr:MAG: hypothetical protein A3E06_03065 [Candidatus Giovannonibacteria bacterium RIFCSPHIGHO2_12_FULL_44_42]OGF78834.1 MAG: hypothetical protein A2W54_04270 [Candidatus Giovannonibacteria bacterium RIFCSPHIGHO2_02_43_13]OGF90094.1 MAG: hypothetical protein A3I94_03170 [Candidatus Giovannonibacteria bacterium RIFCSPLOWO2_02_FULL_43_54]OGF96635.1 MAG: hypothetical protein A3H08_01710 [Candidatus Giovannonibacteria bacterium RIFCSPLOWO2_12_FULL_44_32]
MGSDFFNHLRKLLEKLPGIGPRQANRFLWALLDFTDDEQNELSNAIAEIPKHLKRCNICFRAFSVKNGEKICSFCGLNSKRDKNKIMVLEKDSDLLNMERAGVYDGLYHILGGMIDPLEEKGLVRERIKKLFERVNTEHSGKNGRLNTMPKAQVLQDLAQRDGASRAISQQRDMRVLAKSGAEASDIASLEIILALSPTKLGEFTSNYITRVLEPLKVKITRLARGLSTGIELEYADEMTLRNALDNRR